MRTINPRFNKKKRNFLTADEYRLKLSQGDRFALSEVLTLIESTDKSKRAIGLEVLEGYQPNSNVIRIGITGSPGVGKSSVIESLGLYLIDKGMKVAVLAIDPSSQISQGSILGDKTRMNSLSVEANAFIRPTSSSNILGGVSRATKESISMCEMAGYDVILVESVGVGQSEVAISKLVDVTLLLLLPGGGDEVQGIKRGVMELADILIVNKADGDRLNIARKSKKDYRNAVMLIGHALPNWKQPVLLNSNEEKQDVYNKNIWNTIQEFVNQLRQTELFDKKREQQEYQWLEDQIHSYIINEIYSNHGLAERLEKSKEMMLSGNESVFRQLSQLIDFYKSGN